MHEPSSLKLLTFLDSWGHTDRAFRGELRTSTSSSPTMKTNFKQDSPYNYIVSVLSRHLMEPLMRSSEISDVFRGPLHKLFSRLVTVTCLQMSC
ncbi:hypothetical protein N7461_001178 [Penicillium sp. DV-2018c]|nr:hypothetical protein N7461_001178 [Penicillium sp. DV-2018c]